MRVIERKLKFLSGQIKTKYMEEPLFQSSRLVGFATCSVSGPVGRDKFSKNLSTKVAINEYHLVINFEVLEKRVEQIAVKI
jgi:hypothetical protein